MINDSIERHKKYKEDLKDEKDRGRETRIKVKRVRKRRRRIVRVVISSFRWGIRSGLNRSQISGIV